MGMFVSVGKAAEYFSVCVETIRRWCASARVMFKRTLGGHRRVWIGPVAQEFKIDICYARVSSKSQRDDLARQIKCLKEAVPGAIIVEDMASGMNWKRKGLRKIIDLAQRGRVRTVNVCHRDRLGRACYDLLQEWLRGLGVTLHCLMDDSLNDTEIMVQEVMSMLHVYSCRLHGRRSYVRR